MKYIVTLNGKKYEVEVEKGNATAVYVGKAEEMTAAAPQANRPQRAPKTIQGGAQRRISR